MLKEGASDETTAAEAAAPQAATSGPSPGSLLLAFALLTGFSLWVVGAFTKPEVSIIAVSHLRLTQ